MYVKKLFISFVCGLLSACSLSSRMIDVTNQDTFESPYLSFKAPTMNWSVYDRKWRKDRSPGRYDMYIFQDALSNGSLTIQVTSKPTKTNVYFDKSYDFEAWYKRAAQNPKTIERNREQRITYNKDETQYFQGMKCAGGVFSRGYGGDMYRASSKNYILKCGYYHKTEGKRLIVVSYRYYGASGVSRLQEETGMKASDIPPLSEAERVLKNDLKEVLDSIVLKDVDWDRMNREGLLYDKPYKTIRW